MENKDFCADLHCHTTYSDSSVNPFCLAALAKAAGLGAIAVTDHDTFEGLPEAFEAGKRLHLTVIGGIELSSYDYERGRKVHILVYNCKNPEALAPIYSDTTGQRKEKGEIMAERVSKMFGVPMEVFRQNMGGDVLFKQHIMHGLMNAGIAHSVFGNTFRRLFGKGEGNINEPIEYPDVHKVLKAARESEGAVVLAHPAAYHSEELMTELIRNREIDGIEAFHQSANAEQSAAFEKSARENGLLVTGGTDFHGMYHNLPIPVGSYTTGREDFDRLLAFIP